MKPVKIVQTHREVHMMGDSVAVCWNTKDKQTTEIKDGGWTRTINEIIRTSEPYIDFVWMREMDGMWYEDDDSPVAGGLSLRTAKAVRDELSLAIEYLKEQTKDA
jgi:hypothetical protein